MTVDAYDQNGALLTTSGFASNNVNTGTMDKLILSRPTPDIKSVRVHDSGNYWLIDAICTDAPGVNCGSLNLPDYKQFTAPSPSTWPTEEYDDTGSTISALGCGLTSLVDLLRGYGFTSVNGQDVNPSTLNTWLKNNNGYDQDGNLQWWAIDTYTGNRLVYNNKSVLYNSAAPTLYSTTVDKELFDQRPVILRVRNGTNMWGHFVVATGKCGNTYKINDPGHSNVHSLPDAPYNGQWAGYRSLQPAVGLPRPIVVINMPSPADVLVTGPDGKRAGFDPVTRQFLSEIPGSSYSDEGGTEADDGTGRITSQFRSLQISQPVGGQYQVLLSGAGAGAYRMEIITRDASNLYGTQNIRGTITTGNTQSYSMLYSPVKADAAAISSPGKLIGGGNIGTVPLRPVSHPQESRLLVM